MNARSHGSSFLDAAGGYGSPNATQRNRQADGRDFNILGSSGALNVNVNNQNALANWGNYRTQAQGGSRAISQGPRNTAKNTAREKSQGPPGGKGTATAGG